MKGPVVALANQKGGVGKTTLSRELGVYAASVGIEVLLVDLDPQGNLSRSLLDEQEGEDPRRGLYEGLSGDEVEPLGVAENLWILPGDRRLAVLEKSLIGELDGYQRLGRLLDRPLFERFALTLVDCPPSLGLLSLNGLVAAGELLIPMSPALYSLQGTNDLMESFSKVRSTLNPDISLLGVIVNAYERVPVIAREIRREIEEAFGAAVFRSVLSRSIKLEEAIASGRGVIYHRHLERSRAKAEVEALGRELLSRLGLLAAEAAGSRESRDELL